MKLLKFIEHLAYLIESTYNKGIFRNVNNSRNTKKCLILYITRPFSLSLNKSTEHQSHTQVVLLSKILGDFGYDVDVVNFNDNNVRLTTKYDLVIDIHPSDEPLYISNLASNAKKILYITGSNPHFSNSKENLRIADIQRMMGVRLSPRRWVEVFPKNLQSYSGTLFMGNEINLLTFGGLLPNVHFIQNYGDDRLNDISTLRKLSNHFLYLGGNGQILKGLDIVLKIFSRHPELKLVVTGNYKNEKDFYNNFKSYFDCPNICDLGFVNTNSKKFREIAEISSFMIYPSHSEGMSGSVLTAMSAGVIPVLSKYCGILEKELIILNYLDEVYIEEVIRSLSLKDETWIQKRSELMKDLIKQKYSVSHYVTSVTQGISEILSK